MTIISFTVKKCNVTHLSYFIYITVSDNDDDDDDDDNNHDNDDIHMWTTSNYFYLIDP